MERISDESDRTAAAHDLSEHLLDLPPPRLRSKLGKAAMKTADAAYEAYLPLRRRTPPVDSRGVRVSIPGHPEIVAYKLEGASKKDQIVDDLIKLNQIVSQKPNDLTA